MVKRYIIFLVCCTAALAPFPTGLLLIDASAAPYPGGHPKVGLRCLRARPSCEFRHKWELASYPLERHAYQHPASWYDQYRRIYELFERTLK